MARWSPQQGHDKVDRRHFDATIERLKALLGRKVDQLREEIRVLRSRLAALEAAEEE